MKGRRSTPGRYFRVAEPGTAWGGTNIEDPLSILQNFNPKIAWPGLRLLMVSTTGEHYAYFELDESLSRSKKNCPVPSENRSRGSRKIVNRRSPPYSSWAGPADRSGPESPKIR